VDNHISNNKFCLARLLNDRAKEPIYRQITSAKSIQDLCNALQMDYRVKLSDVKSRGENSTVAKAADGIFESRGTVRLTMANAA
jgi:hypothetical protein